MSILDEAPTIQTQHLTPQEPAPSPYLPGTNIQFAWDSTSIGYLKTCPRLYQYIMIEGWGSTEESIHLRFGQEYHSALQDYDIMRVGGADHEEALRETVRSLLLRTLDWRPDRESRAGKYKNPESLVRTVIWYLERYAEDPAKVFVLEDGRAAVELSFRFELGWGPSHEVRPIYQTAEGEKWGEIESPPYLLCGHLDKVVDFNGALFVMDHKTTTTTPGDYYFDQFSPSNQMSLYTLAGQLVLESPVKGVIINAAQIMMEESRFVRGFTYRTPDQLNEWQIDLRYWLSLAESFAEADYWPQNDTACDKFGGCRFRSVCSKSPQVREGYLKSRFNVLSDEERWNPLRNRG